MKQKHPGKRVRLFFQDEARVGLHGELTRVWARKGTRPCVIRQTEYEWAYLWAAIDPVAGELAWMVGPTVNTALMNTFLAGMAEMLAPDEHAILVLDNAGWHVAKALTVPSNITLLPLPPYSPELNPAEHLWHWLKSHHLSNRVYDDYDDLKQCGVNAFEQLTPERLQTVCAADWLTRHL